MKDGRPVANLYPFLLPEEKMRTSQERYLEAQLCLEGQL